MTKKRFTINGKEIIQDKQVWCMANSEHCADVIATAMNELAEENKQLKKDVEYWKQVASQYNNALIVFEHCKKYKTECKDIHWSSD